MSSQQPDNSGISPRQVVEGIAQIGWICHTAKMLHAQHHTIQLFGLLNPLRNTEICIVTENELEWLFSQTETALLNSPAFDAAQVSMLIFCCNCQDWLKPQFVTTY